MDIHELKEKMQVDRIVTLDYETYYARDYSLSDMTPVEYVEDSRFRTHGVSVAVDDETPVWRCADPSPGTTEHGDDAIRQLMVDAGVGEKGVAVVGFNNILFDDYITTQRYGLHPWRSIDVMNLAYVAFKADPAFNGFSLNRLAKYLGLGEKISGSLAAVKGMRKLTPVVAMQLGNYANQDVSLTRDMLLRLLSDHIPWWPELIGEHKVMHTHHLMFNRPLLEVDSSLLEDELADVDSRRDAIFEEARIVSDIPDDIPEPAFLTMLRSQKFIRQKIVEHGELPPRARDKKTNKLKFAFNKQNPAFLAMAAQPTPLGAILRGRMAAMSNLEVTRIATLLRIAGATGGRLPVPLKYCGAKTGRSSGAMSINLQNLPRKGNIRKAIRAPKGYKLVIVDSSAIEAKDSAAKAGAKSMLDVFNSGGDVYNWMAGEIYGREIDRHGDDTVEGFLGKLCILGLSYGMSAKRFKFQCRIYGLSEDDAPDPLLEQAYRTYHKLNPEINELQEIWFSELHRAVVTKSLVVSSRGGVVFSPSGVVLPSGRMLSYPGLQSREGAGGMPQLVIGLLKHRLIKHVLMENIIQASSRDIVFHQVQQHSMVDDYLALMVHDEAVFCVPEALAEDCYDELIYHMSRPPKGGWADDVPVGAEGGTTDYYRKL